MKCKNSKYLVIDEEWNHEYVCQTKCRGYFCYCDEECKGYEPEGEKMTNNGLRVPDPPEYPEYDGCEYGYAQVDEGDECIGCVWYETCKEVMKE